MSPALPSAPDLTGRTIGRYRVLGPLGRGGMGLVYRAEDPRLGRHVAIKLLPGHLSNDPVAKERLLVEARAASALDHPHICTVYEVGEADDGTLFLVMACYEGQTLADLLVERRPLPVEEAVTIAQQVASGLAAAHRKGIVHRDLKPSNIFLCDDESGPSARILDFGVAKVEGVALTRPGATLGTVEYAAPEQARGEVDARSDLWALGVVLYEMLTGRRPFEGDYDAALLYAILNLDPEPVRTHRPEVPEAVEAVVLRLLEKDPADRFQTAAEAGTALGTALPGVLGPAGSVARRVRSGGRWQQPAVWSGAAFLLALAVLGAWALTHDSAPTLPAERHIVVLPFTTARDDPDSRAFADGLVEVVVTELTGLERYQGALQVIPTSEVRAQDIESAGAARAALGATLAVSGRIEPGAEGLTVRLHLEDAATLRQIASTTLSRPASELAALRDDVLAALAQMLDVELQPEARAALAARNTGGTRNSAAYDAYVRGLGFLKGTTPDALRQAIEAFERAVREDARFALAHARLAEAALRMYELEREGQWVARAEQAVDRAVALTPEAPEGYVARALLYTTTGRYDAAVQEARQALDRDPASDDAYAALAGAYEAAGDVPAAEAAYREAIARKPGDWVGYHRLGRFYYHHGRYAEALAAWQRVIQLIPDQASGYNALGAAYHAMGQADSAYAMFERSAALYPSYQPLANLAALYYYDGLYAEAAHTYRRALDLDDHNHEAWNGLAGAYERLGDTAQARTVYREAAARAEADHAVNPNDPATLALLATYYVSLGDTVQARRAAGEAAALDPKQGQTAFYIALAYEQTGDRDEALTWVRRAIEGGFPSEDVESTHALADLVEDPHYRRGER